MHLGLPTFLSPHLILGGARSGKSDYAETLISSLAPPYVYIATAQITDREMEERIRIHRERRGDDWETIECPVNLVEALSNFLGQGKPVLVDCITLWLNNLLLHGSILPPEKAVEQFCEMLRVVDYPLVLVSNEVGLGIVPESHLGRRFRDLAGWTNQQIALACNGVTWVMAGLPMPLKGDAPEPRRIAVGDA